MRRIFCLALFLLPAPALAQSTQEQTTYQYDTLGRLVKVTTEAGQRVNAKSDYSYDPAGNRTNVKVETFRRAIVVPLKGMTVIPIR